MPDQPTVERPPVPQYRLFLTILDFGCREVIDCHYSSRCQSAISIRLFRRRQRFTLHLVLLNPDIGDTERDNSMTTDTKCVPLKIISWEQSNWGWL